MTELATAATTTELSQDLLARRAALPTAMSPVVLTGDAVRLVPLDVMRDGEELYRISNGSALERNGQKVDAYDSLQEIWQFMLNGPFADYVEFETFLKGKENPSNGLAYTVFQNNFPVGMATYMNNYPEHLKVELGSIWFSPLREKGANVEAVYLLLKHAFELGYRRVEWKCDNLNERSKRAAEKLGFKFEAIQESHFIVKNKNRDTAWYRILDREWDEVKTMLEKKILR